MMSTIQRTPKIEPCYTKEGLLTLGGIVFSRAVTMTTLNAVKNYQVREDDVWVLSYPKSGMSVY